MKRTVEISDELTLYCVCSDYSLEVANEDTRAREDWSLYKTHKVDNIVIYTHKKHKEIHYVEGPAGYDNKDLDEMQADATGVKV